jgi:Zn-dependent protease
MTSRFKIATIGGIEVYVDLTWLVAFAFFTWSLGSYYDTTFSGWGHLAAYLIGAISTLLLFVSVLLHELGHSFTARSLGLPVNTITLFIFGGVSNLTREPESPRVEFLVTAAGPLTSLLLAVVFFLLHAATGQGSSQVSAVLGYLASINLILAIFNLIPAFPLDGGRIFRSIVWAITHSLRRATRVATVISRIFAYIFIAAGLVEALVFRQIGSGLWLAFIGWYLNSSATASSQQAVMDHVLREVDVKDVMDRAPPGISPSTPVQALVFDHLLDGNLGLVTLSDLRHLSQDEWSRTAVERIMTPVERLRTVAPNDDLQHAIGLLADNRYHQLPVLTDARLVGLLNRDHVMQYLQRRRQLEDLNVDATQPSAEARGRR